MKEKFKNNKTLIYTLLSIISLFIFINGYNLFSDGMFMDGLIYSAIANNLSEGMGSFWDLQFGEDWEVHFREHPPLSMYVESIFHRIFGASFLVERFYSFGIYLATLYALFLLWIEIKQPSKYFWVPALLYSLIPIVGWSIANNMLENLMSLMCLFSVIFYIKSTTRNKYLNLILMSLFIFLAFLTKGVVGLFPFAFPFIWNVVKQNKFSKIVVDYLIIGLGFVSFFGLLFFFSPKAYLFLEAYIMNQVVGSVENVVTVNSRFEIILAFLNELIIPFVFFGLLLLILKVKKTPISLQDPDKLTVIFLMIALCGVLPIMISLKQRVFYIVPVFTFATIAFSLYLLPIIKQISKYITYSATWKKLTLIPPVLGVILIIFSSNQIGRDQEKINDLSIVSEHINRNTIISIDQSLFSDWSLRAYFMRNHGVSLSTSKDLEFLLTPKDVSFDTNVYNLTSYELDMYQLLEIK